MIKLWSKPNMTNRNMLHENSWAIGRERNPRMSDRISGFTEDFVLEFPEIIQVNRLNMYTT